MFATINNPDVDASVYSAFAFNTEVGLYCRRLCTRAWTEACFKLTSARDSRKGLDSFSPHESMESCSYTLTFKIVYQFIKEEL